MPILHRFLLAFGLIIGIGAIESATTIFGLRSLSSELDGATAIPIAQVDAAWRASAAFLEADLFLASALDGIRDRTNADGIARFRVLSAPIERELQRALASGADASNPRGTQLVETVGQWNAAALVLLGDSPATAIPAPHVMEKRGAAIRAALQGLVTEALAKAATARVSIQTQADRTQIFALGFAVVAILVGIAVALPFALALTRPLQMLQDRMRGMMEGDLDTPIVGGERADEIGGIAKVLHFMRDRLIERRRMENEALVVHRAAEDRLRSTETAFAAAGRDQTEIVTLLGRALEAVATGDLTARIVGASSGEYAKLGTDFNKAIESIQATVSTVVSTTDELQGGSQQIAQAAVDLSQRSEHQAARLRETAEALGAVSEAIRGTATSTRQASAAISAANVEADRSGAMMQDAIKAIGRIEDSSDQITRIIGVIDEIAFQTNILALNAAVEAARAGEGGKGFSVVAAEVRALAQRSAEAAKEIKALILQTSVNVKDGADLIGRTGEVISMIMSKVADIDQLVGQVATAAENQARGLNEVVASVSEADRATQRNAKIGEESAASVQHLHDQATTLAGLVGRFKITEARDAVPRSTARQKTSHGLIYIA